MDYDLEVLWLRAGSLSAEEVREIIHALDVERGRGRPTDGQRANARDLRRTIPTPRELIHAH